jgi:hypothetical protein
MILVAAAVVAVAVCSGSGVIFGVVKEWMNEEFG